MLAGTPISKSFLKMCVFLSFKQGLLQEGRNPEGRSQMQGEIVSKEISKHIKKKPKVLINDPSIAYGQFRHLRPTSLHLLFDSLSSHKYVYLPPFHLSISLFIFTQKLIFSFRLKHNVSLELACIVEQKLHKRLLLMIEHVFDPCIGLYFEKVQ